MAARKLRPPVTAKGQGSMDELVKLMTRYPHWTLQRFADKLGMTEARCSQLAKAAGFVQKRMWVKIK